MYGTRATVNLATFEASATGMNDMECSAKGRMIWSDRAVGKWKCSSHQSSEVMYKTNCSVPSRCAANLVSGQRTTGILSISINN